MKSKTKHWRKQGIDHGRDHALKIGHGGDEQREEKKERKKLLEVVTALITAVMVVKTMVTGVMEGRDLSWLHFSCFSFLQRA